MQLRNALMLRKLCLAVVKRIVDHVDAVRSIKIAEIPLDFRLGFVTGCIVRFIACDDSLPIEVKLKLSSIDRDGARSLAHMICHIMKRHFHMVLSLGFGQKSIVQLRVTSQLLLRKLECRLIFVRSCHQVDIFACLVSRGFHRKHDRVNCKTSQFLDQETTVTLNCVVF